MRFDETGLVTISYALYPGVSPILGLTLPP